MSQLFASRLDLQRAVLEAHKTFVDVHQNPEIIGGSHRMRIERLGFGDLPDDENIGRGLRARRLGGDHGGTQGAAANALRNSLFMGKSFRFGILYARY